MKRSYYLLIGVLVVVVLAFTYAKSYLTNLESRDTRVKREIVRRQVVDSLQQVYDRLLVQKDRALQERYDSLLSQSNEIVYTLESQLNLLLNPEYDPARYERDVTGIDSTVASLGLTESGSVAAEGVQRSDEGGGAASIGGASPKEYEIYIAYLEKTLALPKDLSSYEKKVSLKEVRNTLMTEYSLTEEELDGLLLRFRERAEEGKAGT
jgi:hypothetical protein